MKKMITATLLGGAILGSLLGAGTASAATQDYLNSLKYNYSMDIWDYPLVVNQGYTVCGMLWNDVNPYSWLIGNGYDSYEAGAIISSARYGLCPGNAVTA